MSLAEYAKTRKGKPRIQSRRTLRDGLSFQSKREADRWSDLKLRERAGQVRDIRRQVRFALHVLEVHVCTYVADFVYFESGDEWLHARQVIEDAKGHRTEVYRLKCRLMLACYGITIRET